MRPIGRPTTLVLGAALGLALALLAPIYPHRSVIRSSMVGQGGDRIDDRWSLRTSWGLVEGWRYDAPRPLELVLDAAALALVIVLAVGLTAVLARRSKIRA